MSTDLQEITPKYTYQVDNKPRADALFQSIATGRRIAGTLLAVEYCADVEATYFSGATNRCNEALLACKLPELTLHTSSVRQLKNDLPAYMASDADRRRQCATAAHIAELAVLNKIAPVDLISRWLIRRNDKPTTQEPPYCRLALYNRLLEEKPGIAVPQKQLAEATGTTSSGIRGHVISMLRGNLVFPDQIKTGEFGTYATKETDEATIKSALDYLSIGKSGRCKNKLGHAVLQLLAETTEPELSVRSIWQQLINRTGSQDLFSGSIPHNQRIMLAKVMRYLESQSIVTETGHDEQKVGGVGLTDNGRTVLEKYKRCLELSLGDDNAFVVDGVRKAKAIIDHKPTLGWLLSADFTLGMVTQRKSALARQHEIATLMAGKGVISVSSAQVAVKAKVRRNRAAVILNNTSLTSERIGRQRVWQQA